MRLVGVAELGGEGGEGGEGASGDALGGEVEAEAAEDPLGADADVAVCYGIELGARELGAALRLRGIVSPTIGYEWIDEDAASALGIAVANGAVPENRESMAEAAVLLMLAALYDLPGAQQELARDTKSRTPPRMLKGKRIGLVGYGEIARAIVARLTGRFDSRLLANSFDYLRST